MILRDFMTRDVLTTSPDATVVDAARAMSERKVGSACVTEEGALRGIITERDVLRAAASARDLGREAVTEWMTADPVTVAPDETPSEVARIMREHGFRHMPVCEGGDLVGIVSLRDLWNFAFLPSEPEDMTMRP